MVRCELCGEFFEAGYVVWKGRPNHSPRTGSLVVHQQAHLTGYYCESCFEEGPADLDGALIDPPRDPDRWEHPSCTACLDPIIAGDEVIVVQSIMVRQDGTVELYPFDREGDLVCMAVYTHTACLSEETLALLPGEIEG